ncbi:hypothetical protein GIB19_10575 [Pseudomonas sp. ITEM 17296]|uniref:hypothetical protein n=1 Tax=Pseudomonas sp. ITEM 17296 TaxID=2790281 RepID=UPI00237FF42C|nr:hypothetical protein [Pseudomonas sp. ITEM 17296]MDE4537658.1 hypothetical protein [Pseudomonas sp. ITEM 17296]
MDQTTRALVIKEVLANAKNLGISEAIKQFGQDLPTDDQTALIGLSDDEIGALDSIRQKLGGMDPIAAHIVNNNNNDKL